MMKATTLRAAFAAVLLFAAVPPAEAQRRPGAVERQMAVMIGGSRLDIADLNTRLGAAGYPTFDEEFLQVGFAGVRTWDRLLLGIELAGLMRPAATTADNRWRTQVTGGYAMFNVGLDAFQHGGFSLQPKLGVGAGGVNLGITDREAPTFDQVLAQPGRGVTLSTGSLLVDGSVGVVYRTGPRRTARGAHSFLIGVRGGYTQSLLRGEWMRGGTDAPGGPMAGWAGPHVELLIGRSTRR